MNGLWKLALLVVFLIAVGCASSSGGRKLPFWEVPPSEHPPTTDMEVEVFPRHPRCVFRPADRDAPGRTAEEVRMLYETDRTFKAIFDKAVDAKGRSRARHPAALAAVWIVTGDRRHAEAAIDKMLERPLSRSGEPYYSKVWFYALAYDWLHGYPGFTDAKKRKIVAKIKERLGTELDDLDGTGMAVWHGRNQAANGAMIAALGIAEHLDQETLRRATAHYIDAIRALQYTEGWPEGASYWIYNRAGPYAIGADCVMTALGTDTIAGIPIREVMKKIGYWSIYQYAPNGVFEPYGDSSGSLMLGHTGWWTVSVDYYARLSRDPGVMAAGDYLRNRSPRPYGRRPYYWHIALTYDPSVRPKEGYNPAKPELWMREHLPQAMLFGRDSMGVAFFRGTWGERGETYASFKAGDMLAHHDHYDTGHFSIQRWGVLAPQTGIYSVGYWSDHRLGYALQTVSANSLLVLAPGETCGYLRGRKRDGREVWDKLAGGQRVIRPTGFWCASVKHYHEIQDAGPHLERATITAWESIPDEHDYLAADITAAYNSTRWAEPGSAAKVELVTRQFLYLRPQQAFVIYDRVNTTKPSYLPKFLLHHLSKPYTPHEQLLAGKGTENGVLETGDRVLLSHHKRGMLAHYVLLPEKARALKIGGPDYQCYVETDGDPSDGFDGDNLTVEKKHKPLKMRRTSHVGFWRTETEPAEPGKQTRFLNVLLPRLIEDEEPLPQVARLDVGDGAHAARIGDTVAVFARRAEPLESVTVAGAEGARCLLLDARPGAAYRVGGQTLTASDEGVLAIDALPAAETTIRLAER
ncbi:MAG: hypothetical protein R6V58_05705 [Planctomycetota bacterium]